MTKFKLEVEYDYDFDLIGISCHAPDYRLCWAINQKLGIQLGKKDEDMSVANRKLKTEAHYSLYEYYSEEDHVEYFLLTNKNGGSFVVPEQKSADYFLILRNNYAASVAELLDALKSIDMVLTAFAIEPETLKSRENLLF